MINYIISNWAKFELVRNHVCTRTRSGTSRHVTIGRLMWRYDVTHVTWHDIQDSRTLELLSFNSHCIVSHIQWHNILILNVLIILEIDSICLRANIFINIWSITIWLGSKTLRKCIYGFLTSYGFRDTRYAAANQKKAISKWCPWFAKRVPM